ncbi:MAG: Beta-galactosidase C-terminal domain, partial [Ferruginibacter sp.]
KGSFIYEGSLISDEIQMNIIAEKAKEIGLLDDKQIVYPISVRSGVNDQNKRVHYYLNYSGKEQSVVYNFGRGTDLLSNNILKMGDTFSLKPWDVLIVEE